MRVGCIARCAGRACGGRPHGRDSIPTGANVTPSTVSEHETSVAARVPQASWGVSLTLRLAYPLFMDEAAKAAARVVIDELLRRHLDDLPGVDA